ncbi:MAG: hypothetical protein A2795_01730 [Caulobacterales bacterium RIFCSPHIGHO2_01_FULL_67_30]|nr:MAG: hypothetical protein A2795_01730 [Caulobacterales bacterium RIFCSPHIGHO2_01_FULL_67_30]
MLTDTMLDKAALNDLLSKNGRGRRDARRRREDPEVFGISERQACLIMKADSKTVRYRSCRPSDTACASVCGPG